ncbi:MOSC domain-containing protein [Aquabacterium sp.]|uniref:MOSC domain-containing protein n=1 Tax=Aquabacterium sp. TaxID=1872578 RepID=UPI0035B2FD66
MPSLLPRQLLSVNTAVATPIEIDGRKILTGIRKRAVSTLDAPHAVDVRPLGLAGDEQADLSVHGGLNKALYAYPQEHYAFWQTVRAQAKVQAWDEPMPHGMMGENLTLTGLLEADAFVGDQLRFANCVLAISEPRKPCFKFDAIMGFKQATKMMAQSGYCGFYLSVIQDGSIRAGESYEIIPGRREVSIAELFRAKMNRRHTD